MRPAMSAGTMSRCAAIIAFVSISVLSACGRKSDAPGGSRSAKEACGDSSSCLRLGRSWLLEADPSLADGMDEERRLEGFRAKWGGDAFHAVHGAFRTRLGGIQARSGDVVQAVESVDAGLSILEKGRKLFPRSGELRLTQALTFSHLPALFRKREAARDSLAAIAAERDLSPSDRALVEQALERMRSGKE